jgi:GNAT superfamily N-acetyltransferase
MSEPQIRRVAPHDLQLLLALFREHAAYEGHEYYEHRQYRLQLEHAFFSAPAVLHGWVVTVPGDLAGYMTATVDFSAWSADFYLHMDCLYLREPFRRRGLGRRLVDSLRAFARERGISLIQWQTPVNNTEGIQFYERLGAHSLDKKRFFLKCQP